ITAVVSVTLSTTGPLVIFTVFKSSSGPAAAPCDQPKPTTIIKAKITVFIRNPKTWMRDGDCVLRALRFVALAFRVRQNNRHESSWETLFMKIAKVVLWLAIATVGALAFGAIALRRGEPISALWLVAAAVCTYALGYRFYSKFLAAKVLAL